MVSSQAGLVWGRAACWLVSLSWKFTSLPQLTGTVLVPYGPALMQERWQIRWGYGLIRADSLSREGCCWSSSWDLCNILQTSFHLQPQQGLCLGEDGTGKVDFRHSSELRRLELGGTQGWGRELSVLGTCWTCIVLLSRCCCSRSSHTVLCLLLKSQLLASPLPSPAAFGVLDFVRTPVPRSQAGRSCFEGPAKATLSHPLPAPCLEHTSLFVLFNASSRSVQPEAPLTAKRSCPLVSFGGGIRTSTLSAVSLQPPSQPLRDLFIFPASRGRWVSCLPMEERLGLC